MHVDKLLFFYKNLKEDTMFLKLTQYFCLRLHIIYVCYFLLKKTVGDLDL